jgi:hypothetical protein
LESFSSHNAEAPTGQHIVQCHVMNDGIKTRIWGSVRKAGIFPVCLETSVCHIGVVTSGFLCEIHLILSSLSVCIKVAL